MPYKDRRKQNEASKRHYEKNKAAYIARAAETKKILKARWDEFKRSLKCISCGFNHPAALDFHHVLRSPENRKVHALVRNQAYKAAMEEIKKCVVLCANCHRVHHYDEHRAKKARGRKKKSGRSNSNAGHVES